MDNNRDRALQIAVLKALFHMLHCMLRYCVLRFRCSTINETKINVSYLHEANLTNIFSGTEENDIPEKNVLRRTFSLYVSKCLLLNCR